MTSALVDGEPGERFTVNVGVHQGSVLSPFLFAVVIDVISECVRSLFQLLYAGERAHLENPWNMSWKKSCIGRFVLKSLRQCSICDG